MNKSNRETVREKIQEAAKNLEGKLPQSFKHPQGRNPYAHIPKVIKSIFGKSYKDINDEDLEEVLEVIKYCEKNPF
jgi:hypothetical protein